MSDAAILDYDIAYFGKSGNRLPTPTVANNQLKYQFECEQTPISTDTKWIARLNDIDADYCVGFAPRQAVGVTTETADQMAAAQIEMARAANTAILRLIDVSASERLLVSILSDNKILKSEWARSLLVAVAKAELNNAIPANKVWALKSSIVSVINRVHNSLPRRTNIYVSADETITLESRARSKSLTIIFDSDEIYVAFAQRASFFNCKNTVVTEQFRINEIAKLSAQINLFFA